MMLDAPGAVRVVRWAVVAVPVAWLAVTVVNWLSGDFWWWGGGAPLVVFFAVPLLVVAAVPMVALRWRLPSRRERALVSLAAAALALVVARSALSGRTWLWVVPDLVVPPLLFVVIPAALLLSAPLGGRTRWWTAALAAGALALGATQAGVHLGGGGAPVPRDAVRVVSWDTYCWDTDDDAERFLRYLKKWRADVYLLQEHSGCGPGAPTPIDDADLLRREFPGHHVATLDGLLTLSRFPVAGQSAVGEAPNPYAPNWRHAALRTDLAIGGRTVSVYNVHLFDMLYLSASPLSPRFYQAIASLDDARRAQFDALAADLGRNPNPVVASGNFNALPGMGHLRALDGLTAAQGPLLPATLSFAGLRLWRMDWTFTSPELAVHDYELHAPDGLSTHHLQELLISEV
ncbi:endonuclease/exonuclease/phosphatase family protein [Herbidospora cretacea]|uniref:endonuclease/exonuclease/phosphatase family protein n=1 Tax=Herbidospora cretacea TaxID=28444 RepID=UPI000774D91B|nr:endonuclease/exonuclease/phosphatase family protein [Herbidospora cretacea]